MPKIYFCFPYHGVGGVSLLFLRMAEELAAKELAEVWLVDYCDGFMAKHRKDRRVNFLEYRDDQTVVLPDDVLVVLQSMTPWSIFPSLRFATGTRILFWNCYPFNLVPMLPGIRRTMQHHLPLAKLVLATLLRTYRNKMRRLVELMQARRSLVFMDSTNVTTTEQYLGVRIATPEFLPIPAIKANNIKARQERDFRAEGLRFAWVGRVVDFKYYVLLRSLQDLDALQPELGLPVSVTIVGSGDYSARLHQDASGLHHLRVEFIEHVSPDALDEFLLEQVDILLAMGTSALEGAKLGIPTILLDVAHAPVPAGYRYQWLHQRSGYTLGDVLDDSHVQPGNNSLATCVAEVLENYDGVAAQAREYFEQNHELSVIAAQFMRYAATAACTHDDLVKAGLMERGRLYRLFTQLRKGMSGS